MEITEENIDQIEESAKKLWSFCGLNASDYRFEDLIEEGEETVGLDFPGDDDCVSISVNDLLDITGHLDSYTEIGDSTVRCFNISQTLIEFGENWYGDEDILNEKYETESFIASIVSEPILIGMRNLRHECFNRDYWSPCKYSFAIELRYKDNCSFLPHEEEINEIHRFLYFLTTKHNVILRTSELPILTKEMLDEENTDITDLDNYDFDTSSKGSIYSSSDLPKYSPMLKMYLDALAIKDETLRFLLFYKIIEYISPLIANSNLYKKLEARLNIGLFTKRGESFYNSIIDMVRRYNHSISDSELASTVLAECCDLELTLQYVPAFVWKLALNDSSLPKNTKIDNLSGEEIRKLNISLGKILYATRNSIVHAKSNYSITGKECPIRYLRELNKFMEVLTNAIILYYNNID